MLIRGVKMATNYERGRAREYRIMARLRAEGWFCIRSAGSKGPVDIVAFKRQVTPDGRWPGGVLRTVTRFLQVKPPSGYLTPKERAEKAELEKRLGIAIEVL